MPVRPSTRMLIAVLVLMAAACTDDEPSADQASTTVAVPVESVTVPPARLTPFCAEMIELTDGVRGGEFDDIDAAILSTYRSVADDVPEVIEDDFALVLAALEAGAPPPTDPPRPTVVTSVPSATTTSTSGPETSEPPSSTSPNADNGTVTDTDTDADVGFAPSESSAERVNSYVEFECRATANNPGPPATEPAEPVDDADDDVS